MRLWMAKLLAVLLVAFTGHAYAQYEYKKMCIESGAIGGTATCRLTPDKFDAWVYSTGYGVTPPSSIDGRTGYATEDAAKQETLDYFVYKSANYPMMCQISTETGAFEVWEVDKFVNSQEPVRMWKSFNIIHGWISNGKCQNIGIKYGGGLGAVRGPRCKDGSFSRWVSDFNSYVCTTDIKKTPEPCDLCAALRANATHGNPILGFYQEKIESVVDLSSGGAFPLTFQRIYRSHRARDKDIWFNSYFKDPGNHSLSDGWLHNHDIRLSVAKGGGGMQSTGPGGGSGEESGVGTTGGFSVVRIQMGDGSFNFFHRKNGEIPYTGRNPLQVLTRENSASGWVLQDNEADIRYEFDPNGRIARKVHRNGWYLLYVHSIDGLPLSVQNNFGRSLTFVYGDGNKLIQVITDNQRTMAYGYANGRLSTVRQLDGTSVDYLYTDATATIPPLLAGIKDENSSRYSTYTYDAEGWAIRTEKASSADRYSTPSQREVIDPLGTSRTYNYARYANELTYVGASKAPASPDVSPIYTGALNAVGLVNYYQDQKYNQTSYTWDTSRRLPLNIKEGDGTPDARNTIIAWHPQWRLPVTITEAGRVTNYTHDSSGNILTQTVTDTGAGGTARTTSWTYYPTGLIATETAPNGALTSYTYDTQGNLIKTTNALGLVDTYTHDGEGRVLSHIAPNGLVVAYTYDVRGRVLTSNRGGPITTFTYHPTGTLATAALPHGHTITYSYDGAHRLVGWSDNRGSTGTYGLDGMGNRTSEQVRNAQGQMVWQLARSINSLNRLETSTAGGTQISTFTYDSNGDLYQSKDGTSNSDYFVRDPLRRVKTLYNAENSTAVLTYNALDDVASVSDFKSIPTAYTRDALGNVTSENSPDSGSETAQYDALGLPSSITNALGQATTITRDLLGRPTSIVHSGGTTTLRYDQTPASKGYLSEIEDASGLTTYQRDVHGRVTSQTQKLINNDTRTLAYSYHATTGLLTSTTYPGGQTLQNVYDTTGQLTGLTWAGQPIVSGITWSPLGQPTGWSWNLPGASAAIPATRSYNTAGQLTATEFSSYVYNAAGRITSLTQSLMQPASTEAQASSVTPTPVTWTVQYSWTGRITGFTKTVTGNTAADSVNYTYDKNGNRLTSTQKRAGTTTNRTYTLTANRQTGFSQTQTGASTANTSVTYQYNAAGDLLNDGLRSYQYDSQERLEKVTTGTGVDAPSTQYAHNALGQRVFKTEPLFAASGSGSGGTTSGKNLNNLLADPEDQEEEQDKGLIQTAYEFFTRLWSPGSSDAQKLGFAYVYGQDGTLLGEYGMGGSNSTGTTQYIYLPTANGPMPIAAIVNGVAYAVHSDHLNTPRKLTQPDGQVAWQWAYSAFGDEQPTLGSKRFTNETTNPTTGTTTIPEVTFNLRYPGQYYDKESNLHYNYFRSYSAERGRYTQADPIGLEGGFNRFGYVEGNSLNNFDYWGLRPLTQREKDFLEPYIPKIDLDSADIRVGEKPFYTQNGVDAITRGNVIYFTDPGQTFCTPKDLALLGHELFHVGQYREGMTWLSYLLASKNGYEKNAYEIPAHDLHRKIYRELKASWKE